MLELIAMDYEGRNGLRYPAERSFCRTSKTVVYETLIRRLDQKFPTVENSIDLHVQSIAKPSAKNYASKCLTLHGYWYIGWPKLATIESSTTPPQTHSVLFQTR